MSSTTTPMKGPRASNAPSPQRSLSMPVNERARRSSRRASALPLCMSRAQQEARRQSSAAHSPARRRQPRVSQSHGSPVAAQLAPSPTANGWGPLLNLAETNPEVGRAIQMCSFYPTMRVQGTAFENSLNLAHRKSSHLGNLHDEKARSPAATLLAGQDSAVLRETMEESRSMLDVSQGSVLAGSFAGSARNSFVGSNDAAARALAVSFGDNMVQVATAMKRAAMWEVVITTALAHSTMEQLFRHRRLRRALERHMLPHLVHRKKATGSIVPKGGHPRRARDGTEATEAAEVATTVDDPHAVPQGTYLRDHDAFFDSLRNPGVLQALAETMTRNRFVPGDIIARAGEPSQRAMYFLISGKCEVSTERPRPDSGADDGAGEGASPLLGSGVSGAGGARKMPSSPSTRPIKSVVRAGTTFGGIFGGSAVFTGTYRALSQCIVWVLRCEEFEQVFRAVADRTMLEKYKEAVRQHNLWWLEQRYQPSKCYGSIPIYRKLTKRTALYVKDFTPTVRARGETLFAQGDVAGDVYCLLEGTVLRRTKGAAGTYGDDGVAQRVGTSSFTALNVAGRYLLLGEEPHLVPGVQPYSCVISSRAALFFKVPGERFINALLDDPALYSQLRTQLMQRRQDNMRLHPECLAYVPLLQRFPPAKREELAQHAQPRVVGRNISLCDPAQHLSDLIIVVTGSVRDPRHFSHKPTKPLEVPASCDTESADGAADREQAGRGGFPGSHAHAKGDRRRGGPGVGHPADAEATFGATTNGTSGAAAAAAAALRTHGAHDGHGAHASTLGHLSAGDGGELPEEEHGTAWNFSFSEAAFANTIASSHAGTEARVAAATTGVFGGGHHTSGGTAAQQLQLLLETAPLTYPDESDELNPALPVQPARRFTSALAGNWEALFLDKWPNGWESMSTVEAWAIPTRTLRLVFNSCAKPEQLAILSGLRHAQKDDLQLPTVPHTKLPPMSVYTQHGEAAVAAAVAAAKGGAAAPASSHSAAKGNRRRDVGGTRASPQRGVSPGRHGAEESVILSAGTGSSGYGNNRATATSGTTGSSKNGVSEPVAAAQSRLLAAAAKSRAAGAEATARAAPTDEAGGGAATKRGTAPQPSRPPKGAAAATGAESVEVAKPGVDVRARGKDGGTEEAVAWTAEEGRARSQRRLRKAASAPGTGPAPPVELPVNPAYLASYEGVLDAADPMLLRIVRDPLPTGSPPQRGSRRAADAAASETAATSTAAGHSQHLPPIMAASERTPADAWPALTPAHSRWFQAVPSYEPLPGTLRTTQTLLAPPVFTPSSTVLASAGITSTRQHGKKLEGHVEFFASAFSSPRNAMLGGTTLADATVTVASVASLRRSPSPGDAAASRSPLPKRRAYAL